MNIPYQLQKPEFRFFLIGRNRKTPVEKSWNTTNNYMFFEKQVVQHLHEDGNLGIVSSYGNLVVIDFDDKHYQEMKSPLLPLTFTVRTAGKRLNHYYYILDGEMIGKYGIDVKGKRVCDIQSGKSGIVCPPSKIRRSYYSAINNLGIARISLDKLKEIFDIKEFKQQVAKDFKTVLQPEKVQDSIGMLLSLNVERRNNRHFKCPFHDMSGTGNLWVGDDGSIHCFSCGYHANSANQFRTYYDGKFGVK